MSIKEILWTIPYAALMDFIDDEVMRFGAALSFYAMLSMAPLLVMILSLTTVFVDSDYLKTEMLSQLAALTGAEGALVIATVLENAEKAQSTGIVATVIGAVILIFGATAVFVQLQDALNRIWGVKTDPARSWPSFFLNRLISIAMVMGVGFLLLISLFLTALVSALSSRLSLSLPGNLEVWGLVDTAGSFLMITLLFAMIYKFMPDVRIAWSNVWVGSIITALLFTGGKSLIGLYLGRSSTGSVYGAAGSLVALLLWIYYSSIIVFFGAEITQVYTRRRGSKIRPRRFAILVKK